VSTPQAGSLRREYVARLAFIDREIGRLVDALDADGRLDRTALVVVSDHGEALGSHGLEFHGLSTYEALVHVPAVLVAPGVARGAYSGLASHRDLAATIPAAFGLGESEDAELFGRSWFRLRAAPRPRLHRFEVARSSLKLTKTFEDGLRDLFDVVADPGEIEDLEPTHAADAARLERELELYRDLDAYP
jgi:arylsulfatase A-like enzyme